MTAAIDEPNLVDELNLAESRLEDQPAEVNSPLNTQMTSLPQPLDQPLSNCPDLILVFDRIGRITYGNGTASQVFGVEQRHLLGKTCQELGWLSEFTMRFASKRSGVFAVGEATASEASVSPHHNSMRHYKYCFSPLHGLDGRIDAIICTAKDIGFP